MRNLRGCGITPDRHYGAFYENVQEEIFGHSCECWNYVSVVGNGGRRRESAGLARVKLTFPQANQKSGMLDLRVSKTFTERSLNS
jgi:hypothetical protein